MNLLGAVIVWCFLYESRTLSLEHIDMMYSLPELKAWNSAKWSPPGYISRKERDNTYTHEVVEHKVVEKVVHSDASVEQESQ